METFIIAMLAGKKGSGKDSFADRLVQQHAFARVAFADYLKDLSTDLLDKMGCQSNRMFFDDRTKKEEFIQDREGDLFKFKTNRKERHLTYRNFLQIVGTECFRDNLHEDIWVLPVQKFIIDAMSQHVRGVVITDVRFPNEIEQIKNFCKRLGNKVNIVDILIIRPSIDKSDEHSSENSLTGHEFTLAVNNDKGLKELYAKADKIATGGWRMDVLNKQIQENYENNFLRKYDNK